MLGEMMGWKDGVAVAPYGERLRALRRLFHQAMGTPASAAKLIPVIERDVHCFLQRMLDAPPDQFVKNLRRYVCAGLDPLSHLTLLSHSAVNATTLDYAYGYKVHDIDDPLVHLTELVNEQFARASVPGAFVVETLPFCTFHTPALVARLFDPLFVLPSATSSRLVSGNRLETAWT